MEPIVLDSETAVKGLAVLTAIPVAMFALWADYFGRYLEEMAKEKPRFDRSIEILRARVASALVLLFQATLFLGTMDVRDEYPVSAPLIFAAAILAQLGFHGALLRKIRSIGADQVTTAMLRPGTQTSGADVRAVTVPNKEEIPNPIEIGSRAAKSLVWFAAGAVFYMATLIGCVKIAALIAGAFSLGTAAGSAVIITGAIVGIAGGLALNFALGPMHLRKMLPVERVADEALRARLEGHFKQAGIRPPELWIIEGGSARAANAMMAGFSWGGGIFKPGLFVSRSLLNLLGPEELDAVVKHEVSHLLLAHLRQRLILSSGLILGSTCAGTFLILLMHHLLDPEHLPGLVAPTIAIGAFFLTMKLLADQSRLQEIEADIYTIDQLGSQVTDLASALVKLDKHNHPDGIGQSGATALLSGKAHPSTESRIRIMQSYLEVKERRITAAAKEEADSKKDRAA